MSDIRTGDKILIGGLSHKVVSVTDDFIKIESIQKGKKKHKFISHKEAKNAKVSG